MHVLPQDELHATLNPLGVAVVEEFERREVGWRDIVPKAATGHMGGLAEGESPGELTSCSKDGRGERIRTSGLLVPNQALYQAEPRPARRKIGFSSRCRKPCAPACRDPGRAARAGAPGLSTGAIAKPRGKC